MTEVNDEYLKILNGSKALLDKLLQSPKTRRAAEKLIKEHYPDTVISEDIAEPYVKEMNEKVDSLSKDFQNFVKDFKGSKLDDRLARDIERLKSERDWT